MEQRERQIYRATLLGSVVNVALTVIKFAAGVFGHSSALIADAVHSLSDLVSDAIVLVFVKIAGKPEDADHAYGHGKYETLATVIIGLMLAGVGVGIFVDGARDVIACFKGIEGSLPDGWALAAAVLSIVSKEWLYRFTAAVGRRIDSGVLIANAWHHRSDAYTSVATLVGISGAMFLGPSWRVLDPLAAVIVSVFIIAEAWRLVKPALDELLEKSLSENEIATIDKIIMGESGVLSYHHLRTRRVGTHVAISVHVQMPADISLWEAHERATRVETALRRHYGADTFVHVHMEPVDKTHV